MSVCMSTTNKERKDVVTTFIISYDPRLMVQFWVYHSFHAGAMEHTLHQYSRYPLSHGSILIRAKQIALESRHTAHRSGVVWHLYSHHNGGVAYGALSADGIGVQVVTKQRTIDAKESSLAC